MKKIFSTLVAGLMISAQMFAVSPKDVCGQFKGTLYIDWDEYPDRSVYLMPGATENTLTFVLPDFRFGAGKLGNIVLPNIQIDADGKLSLQPTTLYLDSISLRASISLLQNHTEDGDPDIYNSIVTTERAEITLEIAEPKSLPMPIIVYFEGEIASNNNYALTNSDFEGAWANKEPEGWHSFGSATGTMVDFVKENTDQLVQANEVRPGSKGAHSALVSSQMVLGAKANGNLTNGRINAGSTTADSPADNYNFSDPNEAGFNTPFNGRPDSIVFWAKYLPADRNAANENNRARMNTVITTNARYQDPETANFSDAKIASAAINYSATAQMGWQRLSVPFTYAKEDAPAYILATFSTNMIPGGGSSYTTSGKNKVTVLDSVYIDDIELIYNKELNAFTMDKSPLALDERVASVQSEYCDSCAKAAALVEGKSAQAFIAYDPLHKCILVYVVADDYAQSKKYNMYRVDFTDSETEELQPPYTPEDDLHDSVEAATANGEQYEKVILGGRLYIHKGGQWYDITGMRIR